MQEAAGGAPTFAGLRTAALSALRERREAEGQAGDSEGDEAWQEVVQGEGGALDVRSNAQACTAAGGWAQEQWRDAFERMFVSGAMAAELAHVEHADDLLFFVRHEECQDAKADRGPLFVRRRARVLPADCTGSGAEAAAIDWYRSVLLNLVLQTPYYLTVSTCGRESLPDVLHWGKDGPGMRKVTKHVFASPSKVHVNLDSSRAGHTEPALTYPNICFAVDNFDEAFESMKLCDEDECYAVCLWAHRLTSQPSADAHTGAGDASSAGSGVAVSSGGPAAADSAAAAAGGASVVAGSRSAAGSAAAREGGGGAAPPPAGSAVQPGAAPTAAAAAGAASGGADLDSLVQATAGMSLEAARGSGDSGESASRGSGAAAVQRRSADSHPLMGGGSGSTGPSGDAAGGSGGAATATGNAAGVGASGGSSSSANRGGAVAGGSGGGTPPASDAPSILLFSGFVSFQQLQTVVDTTGVNPLQLWMRAGDHTHRVIMRGPSGVGHADVAVTVCSASSSSSPTAAAGQALPVNHVGSSPPAKLQLRNAFTKAVRLAGAAAKAARDMAQPPDRREAPHQHPVRCALMTLVLPVEELATRVLRGS